MSKFDYFRTRASAYRRMAIVAKDGRACNDMQDIAALFDRLADICDEQRRTSPMKQRLFSVGLLVRRFFGR